MKNFFYIFSIVLIINGVLLLLGINIPGRNGKTIDNPTDYTIESIIFAVIIIIITFFIQKKKNKG